MKQKEKILITGILGFIGFHTALKLSELGYDVLGIDNFNDYYDQRWKLLRLEELKKLPITIFPLDLADFVGLKNLIAKQAPDKIIHLAAQAGVRYSLENPDAYMQSNCLGFYHLLEAVKIKKIPILYASSSSVYGQNTKVPFSENDPTEKPMSLYAATKKSNELFAHSYHLLFGIPLIGLRFFTVYGPYGRPDMAYFSFTEKILKDEPIKVYQDGLLKRDFTYISDIVDGIISALRFPINHGIFNLGNHHPQSVNDLITLIEKNLGKKAIQCIEKAPLSDVPITYADLEKSQKILNFSPKISLEDGIKKFIVWYTTQRSHLPNMEDGRKKYPEFFMKKDDYVS
jgi:UDP-glucuronate 4-epimerase